MSGVCVRFREGDLVEDLNGVIFDVKGLVHPLQRVVAFPRFVPDAEGERTRDQLTYRKVYALSARYELLERRFPQYLVHDKVFGERFCEVPVKDIHRHYRPSESLQELRSNKQLDKLERDALNFVLLLKETANVPWNALGISGSILAELHTVNSDIDPIVYGTDSCRKVYCALKLLHENQKESARPYNEKELRALFDFRSKDTQVSFEDFVRTELRKVLQGKYRGHDYFVRCVKSWNEVGEKYGDVHYSNAGYSTIKATVVDASESIFTPCTYKIESVCVLKGVKKPVSEIASFRGRFCEQAENDEAVVAQGKLERMQNKRGEVRYRLLLGNKTSDFMILA
jgi:predicted nucleotidyltransferase